MGVYNVDKACCILLTIVLFSSCASASFTRKATFDKEAANTAIKDLKEQSLVVVLPTESKKIGLLKATGRSREAADIQEHVDKLNEVIISAFSQYFSYTDVVFMPDTLVNAYERGDVTNAFLDSDGALVGAPTTVGRSPYKVILYDFIAFEVIQGNSLINHPFPNRFRVAIEPPEGRPFIEKLITLKFGTLANANLLDAVQKMDAYFHSFYANPDTKYFEVRSDLKSAQ